MLKAILLILLSSLVAALYWSFTAFHAKHEPFDAALWMNWRKTAEMNDPGCIRGGMALDLMRSEALVGLSNVSLLETLGNPSISKPELLSYALGQCRWDWRHSELAVYLDESGKVTGVEIRDTPFSTDTLHTNSSLTDDSPQTARP